MNARELPIGEAGRIVAANIRRLRDDVHRWTYAEVSRRLDDYGRPIGPLSIRRIEEGARRVDVDDLTALATVFKVDPADLMWTHQEGMNKVELYDLFNELAMEMQKLKARAKAAGLEIDNGDR